MSKTTSHVAHIDATPIQKIMGTKPDETVKTAIISALMSSNIIRIGNKRFLEVPPELLDIEAKYQRSKNITRAARIAKNWDDRRYRFPIVVYRNGKLYVVDGQHTTTAAILAGKTTIGVEVLENIDIMEEARLFDTQDENNASIGWYDKYKSRLFRQEPNAVALHDICENYQIVITKYPSKNPDVRRLTSISCALTDIANETLGPNFINWVFHVMNKSNSWLISGSNGLRDSHIKMLHDVYREGVANNCLDEYATRLIAVMSRHEPDDFDKIAMTETNTSKHRSATASFCLAIVHGNYVEGTAPHIITPEDED